MVGRGSAGETDAEKSVDDQRRLSRRRRRLDSHAGRRQRGVRGSGVRRQPRNVAAKDDDDVEERLRQEARDDEGIAAVVPGAGEHDDRTGASRRHPPRDLRRRGAGALHQSGRPVACLDRADARRPAGWAQVAHRGGPYGNDDVGIVVPRQ